MRVFDAVESKEKLVPARGRGFEQIFDGEQAPLPDHGEHTLMRVGAGDASELVARLHGDADAGSTAELKEALQPIVLTVFRHDHPVESAGARADRLFHGVQSVQNFHELKSTMGCLRLRRAAARR